MMISTKDERFISRYIVYAIYCIILKYRDITIINKYRDILTIATLEKGNGLGIVFIGAWHKVE